MVLQSTDDLRISAMKELLSPEQLIGEFPLTENASETVFNARKGIQDILRDDDDRLVVIAGPCSIHDPESARAYGARVAELAEKVRDQLVLVIAGDQILPSICPGSAMPRRRQPPS